MFALIQSALISPAPEECISTVAMIQSQDLTLAAMSETLEFIDFVPTVIR